MLVFNNSCGGFLDEVIARRYNDSFEQTCGEHKTPTFQFHFLNKPQISISLSEQTPHSFSLNESLPSSSLYEKTPNSNVSGLARSE